MGLRGQGGVARISRWLWLPAAWLSFAAACGDDSDGPSANGGSAGSSVVAGSGGFSGLPGNAGQAGFSTGGCGPAKPEETVTRVSGEGFEYPDGTAVTATVGPDPSETATASIEDGTFAFSFPGPPVACSLPTLSVALYVDVNGDGSCQLDADDVFVRAIPGTFGSYAPLSLSQDSARCPALLAGVAPDVVAAARRLCPEIGTCLPFCSEPAPTTPDPGGAGFGGFCAEPPDGGLDGGGTDTPDAAIDAGP